MKKITYIILVLSTWISFAQENQTKIDSLKQNPEEETHYYIIEGDTIPREAIDLEEVIILGRLYFKDRLARRKYLILRRKTRKVYPYAKLAADRLTELRERLENIKSNRGKKKYIKMLQKYMENEFTTELKKMTRTEGQILVKLIHRQTGITMYDLVKEYRSGWKAFWYNSTAKLFNISLKEKYNPIDVEEDYWIEDILQRCFQDDILEEQSTALDFSFSELRNKWSAEAQEIPNKE